MPLFWKRKVILGKIEGTYGADSTPVPGTDAMLVRNVRFRPLVQPAEEREFDVPYYGTKGQILAGQYAELSFEVEMAGGGAAGTAPKYGALLRACGLSETVNAGVSVVYAPVSTGFTSASLYFRMDGREHKLLGAFGNVEPRVIAGRIPVFAFSFIGLHVQPTDTALGSPTLTAFQKPVAVNAVNVTPFTLHAFAGKFRELSFNSGNVLPYRNLPNSEAIRFVDRKTRGRVKLEDELVAAKDWFTTARAGTLGALACTVGTVAGNRVALAAANVQLLNPEIDEEDNLAMVSMGMELLPSSAGNDEFSITVS